MEGLVVDAKECAATPELRAIACLRARPTLLVHVPTDEPRARRTNSEFGVRGDGQAQITPKPPCTPLTVDVNRGRQRILNGVRSPAASRELDAHIAVNDAALPRGSAVVIRLADAGPPIPILKP